MYKLYREDINTPSGFKNKKFPKSNSSRVEDFNSENILRKVKLKKNCLSHTKRLKL